MSRKHNERCKDCKKRIYELLVAAYGNVKQNYNLNLPSRLDGYHKHSVYDALQVIHSELCKYHGFTSFVKTEKLPNVDYYVENPKIIIEFDESQHFTKPREISLRHYPQNLKLGFDREKWKQKCLQLNRQDNDPPYRDEQRAWYDTLRDFSFLTLGIPTIRLLPEEATWCELDVDNNQNINWFKAHIQNRLKPFFELNDSISFGNSFKIGLVFPELKKHTLVYFLKILDNLKGTLDLLVFPEAFETIFPANKKIVPEIISTEEKVQAIIKKYANIANSLGCGIIVGFQIDYRNTLVSGGGNDQYCLYVNSQGDSYIYHKHSTSKFNAFFDSNWSVENNLRTVSFKNTQIGISVCHDSYISLISRLLSKNGADIWVNLSYQNVRPRIWEAIHYTRAVENNVISLCTLHRNSKESNPQKEPYAFSPSGKIRLKDTISDRYIDEIAEAERTGRIYYFDINKHEVFLLKQIEETDLSIKAEKLSITFDRKDGYKIKRNRGLFIIAEVGIEEFCAPEALWKISIRNPNETTIFIVKVKCSKEWRNKKCIIHKIIKGRIIEFSTAFIFIDNTGKILMAAYRSSNYKDSRIFHPSGFPIIMDKRYLKGISGICKISLQDPRNNDKSIYINRINHIIHKLESTR